MTDFIRCGGCDSILLEPFLTDLREPCPECGATARVSKMDVSDQLWLGEMLGMKQKRPGTKKPILETKSGDSFFKKTGERNKLIRIIDRENHRYYELIKDQSGNVIRHVDEPLSEHYGRGSAKFQKHDLPHGHIAVAAYFIWQSEGCPSGCHLDHWSMGIENLKRMAAGVSLVY